MIDKELIRKNFSLAAPHYDQHSSVQNRCALRLLDHLGVRGVSRILDFGCGTGNYTRLLREKFPQASIRALDISSEMVKIAQAKLPASLIEFLVADMETVSLTGNFDFITANASFQWLDDLRGFLVKCRELLVESGVITFSLFGPLTFRELAASLSEVYGEDIAVSSGGFVTKAKLEEVLCEVFSNVVIAEERYVEEYDSLRELLGKIKYTGTRGQGLKDRGAMTACSIAQLEEAYHRKFGKVVATYQVFFASGKLEASPM